MKLLDHRLVVVLGKGGVGRSTVTAALGLAASRAGKRTCIAELGEQATLPGLFGLAGRSFDFRQVAPSLDVWSVTGPECLADFARRKLKLPGFASGLVDNRVVRTFVDAVPGLNDLLLLGKIENLLSDPARNDPRYDVLILDAPATGHGITLLQAAQGMTEIARSGPFFELAKVIEDFLGDRHRTGLALVSLAEELPVAETVELLAALRAESFEVDAVIANRVEAAPIPDPPGLPRVLSVLEELERGPALAELLLSLEQRASRQATSLRNLLTQVLPLPVVVAPRVDADPVEGVAQAMRAFA